MHRLQNDKSHQQQQHTKKKKDTTRNGSRDDRLLSELRSILRTVYAWDWYLCDGDERAQGDEKIAAPAAAAAAAA